MPIKHDLHVPDVRKGLAVEIPRPNQAASTALYASEDESHERF
jgi:hypothetical protein